MGAWQNEARQVGPAPSEGWRVGVRAPLEVGPVGKEVGVLLEVEVVELGCYFVGKSRQVVVAPVFVAGQGVQRARPV